MTSYHRSSNVLVYKVTSPNLAKSNYPPNQYTNHAFNNDETNLKTALSQLSELLKVYLEKNQSGTIEATISAIQATETNNSDGAPDSGLVGDICIQYGVNCYGDNQDTATYATLTDSALILGPQETDFIAGVNHSVTNNNSYLSIGIYNASNQSGIASSSQTNKSAVGFSSGNLNDSAKNVLNKLGIIIPDSYSELYANIDKLFVTFISRDCNNQTIAVANDYCIDLMGTSLLPSYTTPITIFERAYVLPGYTSGANVNYIIYPNIIATKKTVVYKR